MNGVSRRLTEHPIPDVRHERGIAKVDGTPDPGRALSFRLASLADSCAPAALAALKCTEVHATVTVLLPDTQESRRLCVTLPRASRPQSRGYGRSRKRLLPPRSDRSINAELRSSRAPANRGSFPKT